VLAWKTGHKNECEALRAASALATAALEEIGIVLTEMRKCPLSAAHNSGHGEAVCCCAKACAQLCHLAENKAHRLVIATSGGINEVLLAMRRHLSSFVIQEAASRALYNLSFSPENKYIIRKAGGVEILLTALRTHPTNAGVQDHACGAICSLAAGNESNLAAVATAMGKGGVVEALDAMRHHKDNIWIQLKACGILWILTSIEENGVEIVDGGGIFLIIQSMLAFPGNAAMQEQASGVLCHLANNGAFEAAIAEAGGIACVLHAMSTHPLHAGVQEQGCGALFNISGSILNRGTLAQAGISVLLAAMRTHTDHSGVQEQACWALGALALDALLHIDISTSGGAELVAGALTRHQHHCGCNKAGNWALQNLKVHTMANISSENSSAFSSASTPSPPSFSLPPNNQEGGVGLLPSTLSPRPPPERDPPPPPFSSTFLELEDGPAGTSCPSVPHLEQSAATIVRGGGVTLWGRGGGREDPLPWLQEKLTANTSAGRVVDISEDKTNHPPEPQARGVQGKKKKQEKTFCFHCCARVRGRAEQRVLLTPLFAPEMVGTIRRLR
jgi:hypothetical protein